VLGVILPWGNEYLGENLASMCQVIGKLKELVIESWVRQADPRNQHWG
jgi:hypothetical protein